jgi:O-antigen ligase
VLLFALLLGLGLGLTSSRGTWVAVVAGLALLAWRPPGRPIAAARWSALAALVGLVAGAGLLTVRPDVRSPLPVEDREALTSGRDAIWLNTLDMVRDHPVFGVGAGASPAAYDPYYLAREVRGGLHSKPGRDPHNHYLQLMAELGPLGPALFLLGLVLVAMELRRARGFGRRALPVLLCVLVGAVTVSVQESKVFWLGLAWATLAAAAPGGRGRIALTVPGRKIRVPGAELSPTGLPGGSPGSGTR